ncbi:MAG: CPBP family intramembrane metalloprotease [Mediterranea sp.]|nr:CPBP family intramembrane metalloprotease [Mediterranea sp.]
MEVEKQTTPYPRRPALPVWAAVLLYIIACFVSMGLLHGCLLSFFSILPESGSTGRMIIEKLVLFVSSVVAVWACAVLFLKHVDRRPVSELGLDIKGRWKDCLAGCAFAAVFYLIGFAVSLKLGAVKVTGATIDLGVAAGTFSVFLFAAAMEEIMMRGYVQGRLAARMNKFSAMAISALLFSVIHIPNQHIGILPLVNLFLAGLLLGAPCMYTRNLWFSISLHTAWNWIQGPVLGYEVSGTRMFPSMIRLHLPEENIINGGRFGFEGSILCTILLIAGTALIIGWHERKDDAG